jgi:hypothetical protein
MRTTKKVTLTNIEQQDVDLLNAFCLGLVPDLTIREGEKPAIAFHRDRETAAKFGHDIALMFSQADTSNWNIEDVAVLQRMHEKFLSALTSIRILLNECQAKVAPRDANALDRPAVAGKVKKPKVDNPEKVAADRALNGFAPKAGRPKLSPEEKVVTSLRGMGLPDSTIVASLQGMGITPERIQEILK